MKFWLASFPRSGNTYMRNILHDVYGLDSSTFHNETAYPLDENYAEFEIVKTHLLPHELIPADSQIPAVYLLRDGRDSVVSLAHYRSEITAPGSDLIENMRLAILAADGSYFGGWSRNVNEWIKRANLLIRYEDLVLEPLLQSERIRSVFPQLKAGDASKLPSFGKLRSGEAAYGSKKGFEEKAEEVSNFAQKNFRKGKAGGWKEEMPEELQLLFWNYHGETMERMGYRLDGSLAMPSDVLDLDVLQKLQIGLPKNSEEKQAPLRKKRILIEASKILSAENDGIKRYTAELLKEFYPLSITADSPWQLDLYINGNIIPLADLEKNEFLKENIGDVNPNQEEKLYRYEKLLLNIKEFIKKCIPSFIYPIANRWYKAIPRDEIIFWIRNNIIPFFARRKLQKESGLFDDYDLIFLTLMQHYFPFRATKAAIVCTVHDITHKLYPEHHIKVNIDRSENGLKFLKDVKAQILSISKSTTADLVKHYQFQEKDCALVYEGVNSNQFHIQTFNPHFFRMTKENHGIPDEPYFLALSTIEPRKNLIRLLNAFTLFKQKFPNDKINLVIAGKKGWKNDELEKLLLRGFKDIYFTGYVKDVALPVLYSHAYAFCYVSHYEGFGLPLLEAMSCRVPVIYGNNSSMPEIAEACGLAADSQSESDIAAQLEHIWTNKQLREDLAVKSLKRSFDFRWRHTAIETLELFDTVISARQAKSSTSDSVDS